MTTTKGNQKKRVIIGLDISTAVTGICAINKDTGELLKLVYVQTNNKKKFPTFWSKVDEMKRVLSTFPEDDWEVVNIAVEEPAKRFPPGQSSANTIIMLAKYNGILCYMFYEKFDNLEVDYINVKTGRKVLGIKISYTDKSKSTKQKVLDEVVKLNPDFPWATKTDKNGTRLLGVNQDMADAWVMAASCRIIHK